MRSRKAPLYPIPRSLREALYAMVHRSEVPAKVQAEELGVSLSYLENAANPNLEGEGWNYQLRLIVPHTRMTRNCAGVDYIEQSLGRVAVPVIPALPAAVPSATIDLLSGHVLGVAKELGEAANIIQHSLGDRKMDAGEARRCRKEMWDLIQQAVLVYRELETMED